MNEYLIETWKQPSFATILKNKILYPNFGNICYRYITVNGMTVCDKEELYSSDEKVDSILFYHLSLISAPNNVVI